VAAGLRAGKTHARHWLESPRDVDVYDVKADVVALLQVFGMGESHYQVEAKAPSYYHPGRSGCLKQGNRILAYFGEIHPRVTKALDGAGAYVGFEVFIALPISHA
jgi:phenylalanyl-tRNA synthetase beta chain